MIKFIGVKINKIVMKKMLLHVNFYNDEIFFIDKLSKVTGIVYGDVTEKFMSHCEKSKSKKQQIQPWRCFSLICQDRTLDFYCHINQYDVFFWIQGITSYLRSTHKRQTNYSRGKILWKKMLLKLKYEFLPVRPK
jgi:hypothetical protein